MNTLYFDNVWSCVVVRFKVSKLGKTNTFQGPTLSLSTSSYLLWSFSSKTNIQISVTFPLFSWWFYPGDLQNIYVTNVVSGYVLQGNGTLHLSIASTLWPPTENSDKYNYNLPRYLNKIFHHTCASVHVCGGVCVHACVCSDASVEAPLPDWCCLVGVHYSSSLITQIHK